MDFYKDVGWRIRSLRENKHYSREFLAERADISVKFLYEIETGKKGFSAQVLYQIAGALSVETDYILTGKYEAVSTSEIQYLVSRFEPEQKDRVEKLLAIVLDMCDSI